MFTKDPLICLLKNECILLVGKAKSSADGKDKWIQVRYVLIKVYLKEGRSECLAY